MNLSIQQALKYTTDTVRTLLAELQKPEHAEHRWGTDQSKSLRGYLADAMEDAAGGHTDRQQIEDLTKQAELLRKPDQHIVVRDGKVRAGKFTDRHIVQAARQAVNAVVNHSGQPREEWMPNMHWQDVSGQAVEPDAEERHPYGTLDVERNFGGPDSADFEHMHYSRLPKYIAEHIESHLSNDHYGWETPDNLDDIAYWTEALKKAPYEDVDTDRPSEKQ